MTPLAFIQTMNPNDAWECFVDDQVALDFHNQSVVGTSCADRIANYVNNQYQSLDKDLQEAIKEKLAEKFH